MDLLLKQVLRKIEVERQPSFRDGIRVYDYIIPGKNFNSYQALPHEFVFLAPFQKSDEVQILFRHMVKMGYQNAKSDIHIQNLIRKCPNIKSCFRQNLIQLLYDGFSLTKEGLEMSKLVSNEISELEKELPNLILKDHQKALAVLRNIKGNIFLLSNIEFELLKELDKELLLEMNKVDDKNYDSGCSGCTWDSFDSFSDSFDNSCSGDSGGCGSGDSGCSGCGGCGGGD